MDTASTVAFLLGLDKPARWTGVAVEDAFVTAPTAKADSPNEPVRTAGL
jgi:hypothetical protein